MVMCVVLINGLNKLSSNVE